MNLLRTARQALVFLAVGLVAATTPAHADSWAIPTTTSVESPDGIFRLTIEPAPIGSQLEYFSEEVEAEQSGKPVERPAPIAMLERRGPSGRYEPLWAKPLVNQIAPVEVLLAHDGTRVVTFDNWHSVGHGEHVIAIYDGAGELIRSMPLSALLPEDYIEALPHSVSSLQWRRGERISADGGLLLLDVVVPSPDGSDRETVERAINLRDGAVIAGEGERWRYALGRAQERTAAMLEEEARRIAYLTDPLAAPSGVETGDWHGYLREAYQRLTPDYLDSPVAATKVLFDPTSDRFDVSVEWLVESFEDDVDFPGDIAVASPASADALLSALKRASLAVGQNTLKGGTIYVSIDAANRADAERAIARTGARFVWLDPAKPIPQRPERVPGSAAKEAADREIARREAAGLEELLGEDDGS